MWSSSKKKAFRQAIQRCRQTQEVSLSKVCRLFGISRQGIYQNEKRSQSRVKQLSEVKALVQSQRISMPRLGTRKLQYLLRDEFKKRSIKIGRDGLFDFLRSEYMLVKPRRSYHKTTFSKHWLRKHPNLAKDLKPDSIEQLWVADITYIDTIESMDYLSMITDACSRKIVGYHLHESLHTDGVEKALRMALKTRIKKTSLIHHSDRGLQYCSEQYQRLLQASDVISSMTDGYDCYQNALAERMNGIIKEEFIISKPKNISQARIIIEQSINTYNNRRPHEALKYKTPNYVHKRKSSNQSH